MYVNRLYDSLGPVEGEEGKVRVGWMWGVEKGSVERGKGNGVWIKKGGEWRVEKGGGVEKGREGKGEGMKTCQYCPRAF